MLRGLRMDLLPPLLLLLGGLWVQPARAGSHSYRWFYSSLSEGVPRFSIVGFVDDVPIAGYSSDTRRMEPRAPWVEKAVDPQYWERNTERARGVEPAQRANVEIAMERVNQTRGLHSFQLMYGCELRGDGSIGGFQQYAYDGEDFLSFDKDRMRFIATATPARLTADRWNSEKIQAQRQKAYLEEECIEWLQKYLQYGEETLLRRVPPGTMVSRRKSGDRTLLTCYAYGFYPREIEVKWIRSGVEMPLEWSQLLPNPDGTYQIKATVEVQEGDEKNMYECQVEHSSLPEIVTVVYEEKSPGPSIGLIAGVILAVVLAVGLAAFGVWFAFFRNKRPVKDGYTPPRESPADVIQRL
ncbi:RLA class I histocompatibility antigen, alpha chain 19-1-like [Ambystoma mexicanum]|uniref:RLA class I histocompatibility antigen, alpha chain 19-1-like n=1 Tax=Ambystoma mexicanum TaxID=8296 RepID=UPI0037E92731